MTDPSLIESYVSIVLPSNAQCVRLLDRAIKRSRDPAARRFTETSKALHFILSGDIAGASQAVARALVADHIREISAASIFEKLTIARTYHMKWTVDHRNEDRAVAISWLESIPSSEISEGGRADILKQLGMLVGDSGDHKGAIRRLNQSLAISPEQATRIRLAGEYLKVSVPRTALVRRRFTAIRCFRRERRTCTASPMQRAISSSGVSRRIWLRDTRRVS